MNILVPHTGYNNITLRIQVKQTGTCNRTSSGPPVPVAAEHCSHSTVPPGLRREDGDSGPAMHPMDQEDLSGLLNSFGRSPSWEKIAETTSGIQEDFTEFNFWRPPLPLLSEDDFNTVNPAPEFNDFNYWREPIAEIDLSMDILEL
ncbi:Hypp1523 [Branchiostoma lanceolatum]|uniref:Hypp1523 protein n=1 Tax=Branchiostoma lanceolatum TaxID=7740 RepID=A0A8K0EJ89_BRALA|nr:Hypp1523 [Branchiostoma lanceolatum]